MPEFASPRANLIASTAGFSVEILGRTGLRYVEQERSMHVDSEVLASPGAMAVYRRSILKWDPPHEVLPISEEDWTRIIRNIERAFDFQGHVVQVI